MLDIKRVENISHTISLEASQFLQWNGDKAKGRRKYDNRSPFTRLRWLVIF